MDELVSPRERQILTLIGMGKTSKEIAASLKISVATIGSHRKNICRKLGIHSTAALIQYAMNQYAMAAGRDVATPAADQKPA
jgi:two-component system, NarL family, nitrate/nitrite response regulator NarL